MRTGTDLVHIPRFVSSLEKERWKFERDVFWPEELEGGGEHAAGVFALKEAALKAFGLTPGSWKAVRIGGEAGRPEVSFTEGEWKGWSWDASLSHDGEYASAIVVALFN